MTKKIKKFHNGDYNLNLLNSSTHPPTSEFIDTNLAHFLYPIINKPTRITSTTASLIDNIFIPSTQIANSQGGIILADISDHYPVFYLHFAASIIKEDRYIFSRSNTTQNKVSFSKKVQEANWSSVLETQTTQESYTNFHNIITKFYKDSFPVQKINRDTQTN